MLVNAVSDATRKPLVGLPGQEGEGIGITDDDLRFIMDINLTEALLCTRAVGPAQPPLWQDHQRGGVDCPPGTPGEGAVHDSQTALAGFTRAQALEWAPYGIHVNAIAPGLFPDVVTSGEQGMRRTTERAEATVPLRRPGRLREAGFLALYLASSASDYMTGQTILLDGGLGL
jgi:NAD(P)-dependent dehydrogenase (short-subunit alcohol dehydrogenase family)